MLHARKLEELMVFVSRHPSVTDLGLTKLWKLVFFIDQQALRSTGQTITGSDYIKYEHGPVPSRGEKHLKKLHRENVMECRQRLHGGYRLNELYPRRAPEAAVFSAEELETADQVCSRLGSKSASQLSALSHADPAWHYADRMQKLSPTLMAYGTSEDPDGL
jgi:uncharacterized phage-associated protein